MLTSKQKTEFYNGFVEALLWSTGGLPDYSEAPDGYEIRSTGPLYCFFNTKSRDNDCDRYRTNREAVMAAWEDSGEEPPTLDSLEDYELAPITAQRLRECCDAWCDANADDLIEYSQKRAYDPSQGSVWAYAGHDFALTANGRGVGFWDRGLGELGDRLTELSKLAGPFGAYIGDDGLVYVTEFES